MKKLDGFNTKHYCEKCGKLLTEYYGSGRFCSRACANTRVRSAEEIQKIKDGMIKSKKGGDYLDNIHNGESITSVIAHAGYYQGVFCASTGELAYFIGCIDHNIRIERCKDFFEYTIGKEKHLYLPDWYLPDENKYIEIKGETKNSKHFYNKTVVDAKADAIINKYHLPYELIGNNEIKPYLKYCKQAYNTNKLYTLYDGKIIEEKPNKVHSPRTANYKGVNNGINGTLVPEDQVDSYLERGWYLGKLISDREKAAGERMRKPAMEAKTAFDTTYRKGRKQIYKGEERIFVLPEELPKYLSDGGQLGTGHKQKPGHHGGGAHNIKKKV